MKYLLFNSTDNALSISANRLLSMDQTGDTNIRLTFEDKDASAASTTNVDLTIVSGSEKEVMEAIASSRTRRGATEVIADSVNNIYLNANITGVSIDSSGSNSNGLSAGAGITSGTDTVYKSWIEKNGNVIKTSIYIDLDGLQSPATANDIIGVDATSDPCHIGQVTEALNGTIFAGVIKCLETPDGGDPDIDLYSAAEGTGVETQAITALDETKLINSGDHSANGFKSLTAFPAADEYLYLVVGDATSAEYTSGILLIELYGSI